MPPRPLSLIRNMLTSSAVDDPRKIVKVVASDGKTGDVRDLVYTNCKVIGNGSFGIVFQAKLLDEPEGSSEIAIKKVLQDKRFKVCTSFPFQRRLLFNGLDVTHDARRRCSLLALLRIR